VLITCRLNIEVAGALLGMCGNKPRIDTKELRYLFTIA
jgi:hypothetical protein